MVRCPTCDKEFEERSSKTWKFKNWTVNYYICASCKKTFRIANIIEVRERYQRR
jgi:uncharacterized protein YlaI